MENLLRYGLTWIRIAELETRQAGLEPYDGANDRCPSLIHWHTYWDMLLYNKSTPVDISLDETYLLSRQGQGKIMNKW